MHRSAAPEAEDFVAPSWERSTPTRGTDRGTLITVCQRMLDSTALNGMDAMKDDCFDHRVRLHLQLGTVTPLFLVLEQVTIVAFGDRVRLLVHVSVHPE